MVANKKVWILVGILVAIALVVVGSTNGLDGVRAAADGGLAVEMKANSSQFRVTYAVTLVNDSAVDVQDVFVSGTIPEGARFMEVVATPPGSSSQGLQGNTVGWTVARVAAKSKAGPFSYKVAPSGRDFGNAHAWTSWQAPTAGSALSASIGQDSVVTDVPKRGCEGCHELRDPQTGSVTIAYEAKVRGGPNHPVLPFDTTVEGCLGCHRPGTGDREGMGVVAPKMLRDIVHPVHMNSASFTENYKGNCFTCHNVDGNGTFTLLGEKLKTDFRGIPKAPVKGIPPSEGQ